MTALFTKENKTMKKIIVFVIGCIISLSWAVSAEETAVVEPSPEATLTVEVENFKNNKGLATVWLFQVTDENIDKKVPDVTPFRTETQRIVDKRSEIVIEEIPFGDYAIVVLHDLNMDGKPDHLMMREKFGFPNGYKRGFFTIPVLKDLVVPIEKESLTITIPIQR